jgi:hypothetical protein
MIASFSIIMRRHVVTLAGATAHRCLDRADGLEGEGDEKL